ncbi:MAG TPA: beta-galactosidase, partial [Bacillales bacterium]|nr:beta-galactosidase [Bacillales bacterium]
SAEFQSGRLADRPKLYPQDLDLNTRTCVAHGMNALNYYMFVGGENYEDIGIFGKSHEWQAPIASDGQRRPNFAPAEHLGRLFQTIGPRLLDAKKTVKTFVGFNSDDYLTDAVASRDMSMIGEITGKREHFAFDGVLRLLVAADVPFEAVNLSKPASLSPKEYPSLWVFSSRYMDEALQKRLLDYLRAGGKLILYPEIPVRDLNDRPCRLLADGLQLGEWQVVSGNNTLDVLGLSSVFVGQRLVFSDHKGKIIASCSKDGSEEVAAFKKPIGNDGEILVLGAALNHNYRYQLEVIERVCREIGIVKEWTSDNPELMLVERKRKDDEAFLFVHNYDEIEQTGIIYRNDSPEFNGKPVTLPPRSGSVFLKNYSLTKQVSVVYSTVELTKTEISEDFIELSLVPIVKNGSIRILVTGDWETNIETNVTNGDIFVNQIDRPMTLKLERIHETVKSPE